MLENKGKTQSHARDVNKEFVFSELRKRERSCSELAQILGLSKPAMSEIMGELAEVGLVIPAPASAARGEVGRRPQYYRINDGFGIVGILDFASNDVLVFVANMAGRVLSRTKFENRHFITPADVEAAAAALREQVAKFPGMPLLAVCAGVPGKVDRDNRIWESARLKSCLEMDIGGFLREKFKTKIIVENDMHMAVTGEMEYGGGRNQTYMAYIFIDKGLGAGLAIDGKVYGGEQGFATELGLNTVLRFEDGKPVFQIYDECIAYANLSGSIREAAVKNGDHALLARYDGEEITPEALGAAYAAGNPNAAAAIERQQYYLSMRIKNIYESMNIRLFVLNGKIIRLGELYFERLREKAAALDMPGLTISISGLGERASALGEMACAIESGINTTLKIRPNGQKSQNKSL
ncbi:transcriptional regulator [Clostridia bacterium]|nr:transcriptional regulator [Clostridia bacterium]